MTAPSMGEVVAAKVRPNAAKPDSQTNQELMRVIMSRPGLGWLLLLVSAVVAMTIGVAAFLYQTYHGLGKAGYTHPAFWGLYIVTFVFWIGIGHAGTLISAILFLFRAKWRNAINRGAEAMTVFAVMTAGVFPALHTGRVFKDYWLFPYPNQRGLWVNFRSPLLWDVVAVNTYMTISIVFFYVGLIPDLAILRDRSTGLRKVIYGALSLGWQGTSSQWKAHNRTVLHLSGLATPLVLSVHSVVSWDFAMSLVPGWHATIFAPYFVAGAIFGGFAMVLTVLIPVRHIFGLQRLLTNYHFENMTRFLLFTSWVVGYAYGIEYFIAWYSGVEAEQTNFWMRMFGPYCVSTWVMIFCNVVSPQVFWCKKLRTHLPTIFVVSVLINIGMWFERYVIIIGSLSREFDPAVWGRYFISPIEICLLVGSFGLFSMLFLLFLKALPVIAMAEVKELEIHAKEHGGAH